MLNNYNIVLPRSFCPNCNKTIAWHDLLPVISWLILKAKCRNCKQHISRLYPFIEIITAIIFSLAVYLIEPKFWITYFVFFSALIVTIRTDLEVMLISRYATLFVIPIAFLLSFLNLNEINFYQSVIGAIGGYLILWLSAKLFFILRKKEGMGEGDFDLLALIGSFLGIYGAWVTLFLGSLIGSILGVILILRGFNLSTTKIPFGPLLAFGAITYVFLNKYIINLFS